MAKSKKKLSLTTQMFIGLIAGLVFGVILNLFVPSSYFRDTVLVNGVFYVIGDVVRFGDGQRRIVDLDLAAAGRPLAPGRIRRARGLRERLRRAGEARRRDAVREQGLDDLLARVREGRRAVARVLAVRRGAGRL